MKCPVCRKPIVEGELNWIGLTGLVYCSFECYFSGEPNMSKINDPVNHPNHYTTGGIETIDFIKAKLTPEEFQGYLKGNIMKYITREKFKGGFEDLRKARFYLDRLIEMEPNK